MDLPLLHKLTSNQKSLLKIEELTKPDISEDVDLKKEYYHQQKRKHGF